MAQSKDWHLQPILQRVAKQWAEGRGVMHIYLNGFSFVSEALVIHRAKLHLFSLAPLLKIPPPPALG